ncbi:MAG: sulfite exporter TauE/SafE family protein, partial [Synergistes sp.]|nr:sulfite exporter TauE/SafE family protein [Synergistes sp.]
GTEMLLRDNSRKRAGSSKLLLAVIGVTAGVLCGLFGVGALLAACVSRVTDTDASFKANISAIFIIDNTFRVILYTILGLLTPETVKFVLLLIPFALLGLFMGIKCSRHMDEKLVRKLATVLLILSGISLILKNL